jgi:hypothetical protein
MCVCRCGGLGALAELCSQSNPRTSIHFYLGFGTAPRDSRYWPCKIAFANFRPINRFCGFMKHWASRGQVTLGHVGGIKEVVACGTASVAHGSHFTEQRRRCQSRPLLVGGTGGQSLLVTA